MAAVSVFAEKAFIVHWLMDTLYWHGSKIGTFRCESSFSNDRRLQFLCAAENAVNPSTYGHIVLLWIGILNIHMQQLNSRRLQFLCTAENAFIAHRLMGTLYYDGLSFCIFIHLWQVNNRRLQLFCPAENAFILHRLIGTLYCHGLSFCILICYKSLIDDSVSVCSGKRVHISSTYGHIVLS